MSDIRSLIKQLSEAKTAGDLANQYCDDVRDLDRPGGAAIRCRNLENYLLKFKDHPPRLLILAEAAGYRGCRFSGIVFTSEHTLLNDSFFKGGRFERSSSREVPWREASASIVWETIGTLPFPPLMWATVPFHPHKPGALLSNRAPTRTERQQGFDFFLKLRKIFPDAMIVAAGRVAEESLTQAGLPHCAIRHPSHGGKHDFQNGLRAAVKECEAKR